MKIQLKDWIIKERAEGMIISGRRIQNEASIIYKQIHLLGPLNAGLLKIFWYLTSGS